MSEWDVSERVSVCVRVSSSVYPCGSVPLQLGWAQALQIRQLHMILSILTANFNMTTNLAPEDIKQRHVSL